MAKFGLVCICKRRLVLDEPKQRALFGHLCVKACVREHATRFRCKACGRRGRLIIVDEYGHEIRRDGDLNLPTIDWRSTVAETNQSVIYLHRPETPPAQAAPDPGPLPRVARHVPPATPPRAPSTHHPRPRTAPVSQAPPPRVTPPQPHIPPRCPDCDIVLRRTAVDGFLASVCPACGETF